MLVSRDWLQDFVELEGVSDQQVVESLTLGGTEVERSWDFAAGLEGITVAEVISRSRVAGTDRLQLAVVRVPGLGPQEVVCGAPNLEEGTLVPWARPGTRLPGGLTIGTRKFRGQSSQGMLCAPDELGLGTDHAGLLVLGADEAQAGQPLQELFPRDRLYELEILSNRGDCLSHWGVARELGGLLRRPVRDPLPLSLPEGAVGEGITIEVADPASCPLYLGQIVDLPQQPRSPLWLRRRLMAVGSRPISGIVDVANYVMLEVGQPLHTFDLEQLREPSGETRIQVRASHPGETLLCLDGVRRELPAGSVVIAASGKAVALAGVIGGSQSAVQPATSKILLEAASFNWVAVRRTERALGIRTEASTRFEKDLSPELVRFGAARFAQLLAQVCPEATVSGEAAVKAPTPKQGAIFITGAEVSERLGMKVTQDRVAEALSTLHFAVREEGNRLAVTPPAVRTDVKGAVDLVEEVGRSIGYLELPGRLPPLEEPTLENPGLAAPSRLAAELVMGAGFDEAVTLSLVPRGLATVALGIARRPVALSNPLSLQLEVLRVSCLPGLLQSCALNQSRGQDRTRLFEIGSCFWHREEGGVDQPEVMAMVDHWVEEPSEGVEEASLRWLLQVVEALGDRLSRERTELRPAPIAELVPGRSVEIWRGGRLQGVCGELAPERAAQFELRGRVLVAELRVDGWLLAGGRPAEATQVAVTPALKLDLAVLVADDQLLGVALAAVEAAAIPEVERLQLVDEYRGPQLPEGMKGWTFRLMLRAPDHTLTHSEGQAISEAVLAVLNQRVGASRR